MNCILRGVRVIDPLARLDSAGQDVWLSDGRIIAIYKHIGEGTLPVIDLTPAAGASPCVLSPGFIDLHTHVREPHEGESPERLETAARAAAAGGFSHIVTMANTTPPIDTADRVTDAAFRAVSSPVNVLTTAALTRGLAGRDLVDIPGCAASGAAAFSDDGRNAASARVLAEGLRRAGAHGLPVLVHPEHESTIAAANPKGTDLRRSSVRPVQAEVRAVEEAIGAVQASRGGRLHLQHISTAAAVEVLRAAKSSAAITAEVTPHHLSMWLPVAELPKPASLLKVNPPLRTEEDRLAVLQALREGIIDAVATDHAPHSTADKNGDYNAAAAGFIGLETALATAITFGGMGGDWLPVLVDRLTAGPFRVLGEAGGLAEPRLRIGEAATCVLFDPSVEWTVGEEPLRSAARNTPLMGQKLTGRVLLTLVDGAVVYHDAARLPFTAGVGGKDV